MAAGPSIPHYLWAAGHALVLACTLYSLLGVVTFKPHPYAYKLSYLGATGVLSLCLSASLFFADIPGVALLLILAVSWVSWTHCSHHWEDWDSIS